MDHQRELFRIALDRKGELRRGSVIAACEVIDLTEKGVRLKADLTVEVGETLHLTVELAPACVILCTIFVARVAPPFVGARISDISHDDQARLSRFIEQFISLNLGGI